MTSRIIFHHLRRNLMSRKLVHQKSFLRSYHFNNPTSITRSRLDVFRRKMCTEGKKEAKKKLEEEGPNASIPHLLLGMASGVGGSWLGLGMMGGVFYATSSFGDNALAGRLRGVLLIASFIFPPVVGAVAWAYVIQAEWGIGYFLTSTGLFYGIPVFTFMNSMKESGEQTQQTREKRLKLVMNLNHTDLSNLHNTVSKLCEEATNPMAHSSNSSYDGWSFGSSSSSNSYDDNNSFGSSSNTVTIGGNQHPGVVVSPDNYETLNQVLKDAFNIGANSDGVLKKREFYKAMSKSSKDQHREILLFFNRVTKWGMTREVDFREFCFTMMFFVARSEENYSAYQETLFKFLDKSGSGSLGVEEITELVDLTDAFFGKPKGKGGMKFSFMGWGVLGSDEIALESMKRQGKKDGERCELFEFKEILTDMGFSF